MPKSTALIIVNPTAGRGRAGKSIDAIKKLLPVAPYEWEWYQTTRPGDAEAAARASVIKGVEFIVAVGGDGTLHEVVNGVLGSNATIGLIPFGTGNDLARALGLYGSLEIACDALVNGPTVRADVGKIRGHGTEDERHFLVICGTGFIASTAKTVNQGVRFLSGALAYVWGAIVTLWHFKPFILTVRTEHGERCTTAMFVSVSNVATTGGGMQIAPDAAMNDGVLDICLVAKVGKIALLRQLANVFKGTHVNHPAVEMIQAQRIELIADPPQPLLIDGEVLGTTPATISILPGALKIKAAVGKY